jgi:hypothetical protein
MHKVFWGGVVLVAMAVMAACLVTDYAQRYPDSPMGRCARTACRVAMALDPVSVLAPRVGQATYHVVATVAQSAQQAIQPPHKEEACRAPVDEPKPVPPVDVIDLSLTAADAGAAEESSAPEPPPAAEETETTRQNLDEAGEAVTVPPLPIEDETAVDEDPVPDTMPPAKDEDEDSAASAGPHMEELIQEAIEHYHQLEAGEAAEPVETLPMPQQDDDPRYSNPPQYLKGDQSDVEQSLDMTLHLQFDDTPLAQIVEQLRCALGIDIVLDEPALEKEGIAKDWPISLELDGMPMKEALHVILSNFNLTYVVKDDALLITTESVAAEYRPDHCTQTGCHSEDEPNKATEEQPENPPAAETPGGEESEALPGTPPDCREDPHHDQQYPGCPYMGGCPGSMHCPPPAPADSESQPKTKKKKKTAKALPDVVEDTAIRRMKYEEFAMPAAERPMRPDHFDWVPAIPKVDTMEFRPSDAKPGEFDPKPF